jgi:predicted membrane metal-binding protein
MRTGALVLGIIAGLAGLLSAVLALLVGGLGGAFDAEGAGTVVWLGWSALGFSLLGLVGAALSLAKPILAAVIMLVAAIAIAISISLFAIIATPLFLIAALLAFLGRNTRQEEITVRTSTRT